MRPDRGLCTACGATQVLLPARCLPRRAYTADVIGAVLVDVERGRHVAQAAQAQQVPVSTARRWVAAVTRSAAVLTAAAVRVAAGFGDATGCWPPSRSARPCAALTGVLHALGGAAAAWTRAATSPARRSRAGLYSGVDYLARLRESHHARLLSGMGVVDPGGALGVNVTGWRLVNALTGGMLLTAPGGG